MRTVLVGGCFDILHVGHVTFLEKAKKFGDKLVVALESDATVKRLKGDSRPVNNAQLRKKMLLALRSVDQVILLPQMKSDEDYKKLVLKVKPQVIAITKGDPLTSKKRLYAKMVQGKLVEIPLLKGYSTSKIVGLI